MQNYATYQTDVLIIGTGGAGLRSAIEAHSLGSKVLVVGKRKKKDAHTILAQGGINAVLGTRDKEDSWEQHFVDTYKDGYGLADPKMVEILVKEAPERIKELDEWGCDFARTKDGKIDQRYFGAHKYRRTCYSGDITGKAVLNTVFKKVEELEIPLWENFYISQLLVENNVCFGALGFHLETGKRTVIFAKSVIIAAGGHTRIWYRSSSRKFENTGDAMYMAHNAGCKLANMELVQFHPTGMVYPEKYVGTLVTEAVRGEGGKLFNKNGERYMSKYDSERLELSTRDRVALANYTEIIEGRGGEHGGVYLDVSHKSKEFILEKLPKMHQQFTKALNIDISKEPMEVAPTAHYSMGGIVVHPETLETGVKGLYAAGECTSGLHGANRLGGNSLAGILVFGKRAGEHASKYSKNIADVSCSEFVIKTALEDLDSFIHNGTEDLGNVQCELRHVMWECCGVIREEEKLQKGLKTIREYAKKIGKTFVNKDNPMDLANILDLRSSFFSAEVTNMCALERKETRGAHNRSDFSTMSEDLNVNFQTHPRPLPCQGGEKGKRGDFDIVSVPVSPVSEYLQKKLEGHIGEDAYDVEGRLLE